MPYWSLADLQALIGKQVCIEIFDDDRMGYANPALVAQVQALSDSMVDGGLIRVYPGPFPVVQQFPTWQANTAYATGAEIIPAVPNGYAFRAISNGATSGGVAPTWTTQYGTTVTDGGLTWVCISLTPELIRMSSMLWGKALAFERHPEYVKTFGDGPRKAAEAFLDRLIAARSYLADALSMTKPNNVGGVVYNRGPRMTLDNTDGTPNSGDF